MSVMNRQERAGTAFETVAYPQGRAEWLALEHWERIALIEQLAGEFLALGKGDVELGTESLDEFLGSFTPEEASPEELARIRACALRGDYLTDAEMHEAVESERAERERVMLEEYHRDLERRGAYYQDLTEDDGDGLDEWRE